MKNAHKQHNIIGKSPSFLEVLETVKKVKGYHDVNILLQGETGTGKEVLARHIHQLEEDPSRPFIAVNCGAIPDKLFESELFGHEKGSFTGAINQHIGKFELANGGDLFLDEINTLKSSLQCKLLRVIQEREFYRVGGTTPVKVNVRLITASSTDLRKAMTNNEFREDLFYRLNVFPLNIPALRNRKEDILLLADYFLDLFSKDKPKKFSNALRLFMENYSWPGNVRELKHFVESSIIVSDQTEITPKDIPHWIISNQTSKEDVPVMNEILPLKEYIQHSKKEYILKCLKVHRGNIAQTANVLKINRSTIYAYNKNNNQ